MKKLLKEPSNKNILLDTVIAEIVWVLSSYYCLDKKEVIEKIRALIHVDTVDCNEVVINRTLTLWDQNNISYIDAYIAAVAELGRITLFTYDTKFNSIPSITIKEP